MNKILPKNTAVVPLYRNIMKLLSYTLLFFCIPFVLPMDSKYEEFTGVDDAQNHYTVYQPKNGARGGVAIMSRPLNRNTGAPSNPSVGVQVECASCPRPSFSANWWSLAPHFVLGYNRGYSIATNSAAKVKKQIPTCDVELLKKIEEHQLDKSLVVTDNLSKALLDMAVSHGIEWAASKYWPAMCARYQHFPFYISRHPRLAAYSTGFIAGYAHGLYKNSSKQVEATPEEQTEN